MAAGSSLVLTATCQGAQENDQHRGKRAAVKREADWSRGLIDLNGHSAYPAFCQSLRGCPTIKNLLVFTALAFGVATSHQALACDWMHEANQDSTTVVTCANGKCEAVPQQTAKQEPAEAAPTVPKVDVERADLAPITVADGRCGSGHC
jgi:hypothetical protein